MTVGRNPFLLLMQSTVMKLNIEKATLTMLFQPREAQHSSAQMWLELTGRCTCKRISSLPSARGGSTRERGERGDNYDERVELYKRNRRSRESVRNVRLDDDIFLNNIFKKDFLF